MAKLKLTLACWDYDRTRPLIDGRVEAEGIDLDIKVLRPRETFPRMLEDKEFEVSELSLGSYVSLIGRGDCPFVALPVALSKIFRHSCIYVRTDAGIRTPQDLRGKRMGTTQLGSTATIFMNGMLRHEYGVTLEDIHWFIGGMTTPTQRPLIPLKLPDKIKVEFLPADRTLEGMLESGDLDALLAIFIPSIFEKGSPRIARLFPNYYEVEQRLLSPHGHLPDHAYGGASRRYLSRAPVGGAEHLSGLLRSSRSGGRRTLRHGRAAPFASLVDPSRRGDLASVGKRFLGVRAGAESAGAEGDRPVCLRTGSLAPYRQS